jgi:hypothetical protein
MESIQLTSEFMFKSFIASKSIIELSVTPASRQRHSELTRSVSDDFGSKVGPKDEFTIPSNALDQF